jgi:hypothetical protein
VPSISPHAVLWPLMATTLPHKSCPL